MHNSAERRYSPSLVYGVIAQLVERLNGIEEVWGSNPHGSTILPFGGIISRMGMRTCTIACPSAPPQRSHFRRALLGQITASASTRSLLILLFLLHIISSSRQNKFPELLIR